MSFGDFKAADLLHADRGGSGKEVAPSISVTTIFEHPHPDEDAISAFDLDPLHPARHVYSRYTQDVSTRAEKVLSKISKIDEDRHGYAITYASGIAATYAAFVQYHPKRIAISGGYHGVHSSMKLYQKTRGSEIPVIDLDDEYQEGDLCWVETPVNPTGESRNIQHYADKIHKVGGKLVVDSTFAPPPLQNPLKLGADCVLHSGSKYFGGHSDLLCGVLIVPTENEWRELWHDRTYLGNMMGNLEAWLLLRSLRTLHLRVPRQAETATKLAEWLNKIALTPPEQEFDGVKGGIVNKVWHSSIQAETADWDIKAQLDGGMHATFSILMSTGQEAGLLPHLLENFVASTSLGAVESLIEQRLLSDPGADPRLVRISVGVEDYEDLKDDLKQAFKKLLESKKD